MPPRAFAKWMVCQSVSAAFLHVSPRLAAIYLHIVGAERAWDPAAQ